MRKKRAVCNLLFCFFLCAGAKAQEGHFKQVRISFDTQTAAAKRDPFPLSIVYIQVVPVLWDSTRIGFIQAGLSNKIEEAVPDKPWQPWLQEYITASCQPYYKKEGDSLLWVIKDLAINERSFNLSEKGYMRLVADAWLSRPSQSFHHLVSIDTTLIISGADVTHKHQQNIARGLQLLLDSCLHGQPATGDANGLTAQEIIDTAWKQKDYPLLHIDSVPDGIYMRFEDAKAATPSIKNYEIIKEKINNGPPLAFYEIFPDSSRSLVLHPWGVGKNGKLYYNYKEETLVSLKRSGNRLILAQAADTRKKRNASRFWGAMLGGAIGGGIAGAITGEVVFPVTGYGPEPLPDAEIPGIKKGQQPFIGSINMENGKMSF